MSLLKIYDSLGISLLFKQAHETLNMKGVQLESLGYLNFRHSIEWGQIDSIFKPTNTKYQKYWMMNENDLKRLKHESFKEENYDQIENLNEYEAFIKSSYFNRLVKHLNRVSDYMRASANSAENCKDFFTLSSDSLLQEYHKLELKTLTRT